MDGRATSERSNRVRSTTPTSSNSRGRHRYRIRCSSPPPLAQAQVRTKTAKLLQGVTPETFTVNTRTTIKLRDVELILKDLLRKQALVKKHGPTLARNKIVGLLRDPRESTREDADALVEALALDREAIWGTRKKENALELIIGTLETNQMFVSRSVRGFMPQLLDGVHFSGMTVRDPAGRQIFTLVLMAVLVARGIFAPVTFDASSAAPNASLEYDIVGEVLMPEMLVRDIPLGELENARAAADYFKVTPSAITVRALRLGLIGAQAAYKNLRILEAEFQTQPKQRPRRPKPVNAIRKYNGRAFTSRMLHAVDEGRLSEREFCRVVCLNHLNRPNSVTSGRPCDEPGAGRRDVPS